MYMCYVYILYNSFFIVANIIFVFLYISQTLESDTPMTMCIITILCIDFVNYFLIILILIIECFTHTHIHRYRPAEVLHYNIYQ